MQYTDKELDRDSNLYYFQARYYDSVLGRFLGRDKVKLEDNVEEYFQVNPYQYVNNSSVANADDDGLLPYNKTVKKSVSLSNNFGDRWQKNEKLENGDFKKYYSKIEQTGNGWFKRSHKGTDISAYKGTPVYAAADGVIYSAGVVNGYGNTVVIKHFRDDGEYFWSFYAHMDNMESFEIGSKVLEGQRIGSVGGSGTNKGKLDMNAYAVHLHLGYTSGIFGKDGKKHFSWGSEGQFNPEIVNIGKYDCVEQTPAYKQGLSK